MTEEKLPHTLHTLVSLGLFTAFTVHRQSLGYTCPADTHGPSDLHTLMSLIQFTPPPQPQAWLLVFDPKMKIRIDENTRLSLGPRTIFHKEKSFMARVRHRAHSP